MNNYKIEKLYNEPFNYIVIANNYISPLNNLDEIKLELGEGNAIVLFDLLLINGLNSNRYIACEYKDKEFDVNSCRIVPEVDRKIKQLTAQYLSSNTELIECSILTSTLKYLIKEKMV